MQLKSWAEHLAYFSNH